MENKETVHCFPTNTDISGHYSTDVDRCRLFPTMAGVGCGIFVR
ncbi:hypothetical protein [Bacteroides sp.]